MSWQDIALKTIPYPKLRPLDRVICGGVGFVPSRIRRWSAGKNDRHNLAIGVHTGLLVEFHGQLLIAEMLLESGLSIDTLERYISTRKRFIIGFRRSLVFDDVEKREAAQREIAYMYRERLNEAEYDGRGVLSFVKHLRWRMKQNPKKWYCSEFDCMITAKQGCQYAEEYICIMQNGAVGMGRVSPYDLQVCPGWADLAV